MISIFNGRRRTLGKGKRETYYLQMDVQFRQHLHILKGPKLAIFLCLSLHSDRDGWAFPKISTIAKETGYKRDAISANLTEMEKIEIKGKRLLLKYQPRGGEGQFLSNHYLLFPSAEEVEQYESLSEPCRSGADTVDDRVGCGTTHEGEPTRKEEEPIREDSAKAGQTPPPSADSPSQENQTSNGNGGKKPNVIWDLGVGMLMNSGMKDAEARSFLGEMAKEYGRERLAEAIAKTSAANPASSKQYLVKVLQGAAKARISERPWI